MLGKETYLLSAMLIGVLIAPMVGAGQGDQDCGPQVEIYCTDVELVTEPFTCQVLTDTLRCTLSGEFLTTASGPDRSSGEGRVTSWIEVGICTGAGPCHQPVINPSAACIWHFSAGCTVGQTFEHTSEVPIEDGACYFAWGSADIDSVVRAGMATGVDLATAGVYDYQEIDTCQTPN